MTYFIPTFGSLLPTLLVVWLIIRRGSKPRRVKLNSLFRFPAIVAVMALLSLYGHAPKNVLAIAMYFAAAPAGAVLGWFSARHVELTLDDKTGTIMSQPSFWGTAMTAGAFIARSLADYVMKGAGGALPAHHAIAGATDAALLFVAARGLASAYHMWVRTRPLLEQHRAAQIAAKETP
ncbi:MAG TPA: hypothetical protein VMJ73_10290 [Rhizomicrobium sp.]|nr:hypothetical protein [Rhizomicrobium sp.]